MPKLRLQKKQTEFSSCIKQTTSNKQLKRRSTANTNNTIQKKINKIKETSKKFLHFSIIDDIVHKA